MSDLAHAIMEEEDRRILEELDEFAWKGHKMVPMAQGAKQRHVEVCSRCGFRFRGKKRRKAPIPECPMAIVERIMES